MNETEKSKEILNEDSINIAVKIGGNVLKNANYLIWFIFYFASSLIIFYLILKSPQEIIQSKLIDFIITMYFKDKLITVTTLIGLAGALTLLIGHISSENEEKIIGREGKLLSGIAFWHRNFLITFSSLILIIVFTKSYYNTFNYQELIILFIIIIIFFLLSAHFTDHVNDIYDWDTLENNKTKIYIDIYFGISAFYFIFFFYIFSLQYVKTLIFNLLNLWILFMSIVLFSNIRYPRTKRVIVKYSDNKEEYAHLVRIENGFARLITKNSGSKQINLGEIKEMNYDIKYIENFRRLEKKEQTPSP